MTQKRLLAVDAGVNLLLGTLLSLIVPFPVRLLRILGGTQICRLRWKGGET